MSVENDTFHLARSHTEGVEVRISIGRGVYCYTYGSAPNVSSLISAFITSLGDLTVLLSSQWSSFMANNVRSLHAWSYLATCSSFSLAVLKLMHLPAATVVYCRALSRSALLTSLDSLMFSSFSSSLLDGMETNRTVYRLLKIYSLSPCFLPEEIRLIVNCTIRVT